MFVSPKIQSFFKTKEKLSVKQIKEIRRMKKVLKRFGPESQWITSQMY